MMLAFMAVPPWSVLRMARASGKKNHSLFATPYSPLNSRHVELRLLAGAVAPQGSVFADRVRTLKDPVLPRREAGKDFRFHGLRSDEAQIRFHAGETVG